MLRAGTPHALLPAVHWPIQPIEIRRHFAPPFCPRRDCPQHRLSGPRRFGYERHGSFLRSDGRRVPRYRCSECRSSFSKQSFAVSYYLKRPELLVPVASGLVNGAANRQIARTLGCAPSTVTRLTARLGRHALLLQLLALQHLAPGDTEPTVLDHTESFEGTQDDPIGLATLVGQESWFVYGLDACTHARAGKRTPVQEARRRLRPPRDSRGGYEGSAARLLEMRLRYAPPDTSVRVTTDDKPDYARALLRPRLRGRIQHTALPNPERGPKGSPRSALARRRDAGMFANDLLHALARHSMAHHHRETIAFPRRIVAAVERYFVLCVWRNLIKGVSERTPDPTTPGMRKGLAREPWDWKRLFACRLFPDRVGLDGSWLEIYRRAWSTPTLGSNTRHNLKLAY